MFGGLQLRMDFFIFLGDVSSVCFLSSDRLFWPFHFFLCPSLWSLWSCILLSHWKVYCTLIKCFVSVAYVKQLNIPSGVVGACRLDLAYEHFKVLLTWFECTLLYLSVCSNWIIDFEPVLIISTSFSNITLLNIWDYQTAVCLPYF